MIQPFALLSCRAGLRMPGAHCQDRLERIVGKNEAAGAADAGLCHTDAAWAGRVRIIGFWLIQLNC